MVSPWEPQHRRSARHQNIQNIQLGGRLSKSTYQYTLQGSDIDELYAWSPKVEAKIRESERLKADFRVGRVRAIERAKAQLTPEQRAKLATMLGEPPAARPRAGSPPAPQRF